MKEFGLSNIYNNRILRTGGNMKEFKPPYYQLIPIEGYQYAVDKHSWYLKDGEWIIREWYLPVSSFQREVVKYRGNMKSVSEIRIIASTNPNLPDLPRLELDGEEEIGDYMLKVSVKNKLPKHMVFTETDKGVLRYNEQRGLWVKADGKLVIEDTPDYWYKAAKGKGEYSEDDVKDILMRAMFTNDEDYHLSNAYKKERVNEWWSMNIHKPKRIGLELEMQDQFYDSKNDTWCNGLAMVNKTRQVPKIVNGSVIVKRLIYEGDDSVGNTE